MAWIKFEKDLLSDPRVLRIAKTLETAWKITENTDQWDPETLAGPCNDAALPAVTLVCGALVRIWCLADTHVGSDDVLPLGCSELNELLGLPGFCELMPQDWLTPIDKKSVKLPDFHAHNGTQAKKKAVTQKRVARHRQALHTRNAAALPDQTKTRPRLDQTETLNPQSTSTAVAQESRPPKKGNGRIEFSEGAFKGITEDQELRWQEAYPAVPIPPAISQAAAWLQANPANKKSNYARFLVNWFKREQDRAGRVNK